MATDDIGREVATNNQVAQDMIWKGHCELEQRSTKNYNSKWGFLQGPVENFVKEDLDKLVDPNRPNWREMAKDKLVEPKVESSQLKVLPSPKPVPLTTSGMIGWRAVDHRNWPDRYGRYVAPRTNIFKQLNWPSDVAL
ncbi:unnamed protein product [Dicrocoelium dendriticum]|nr:unnamed protein product [Dicrocoelium dendriticum]